MKKVIKNSLLAVVLFSTVISYAGDFSKTANDKKENITNVSFGNLKQGSVLIIKDNNGLLLYKELIEKSGEYSKGFDLTALPNGNYYFELNKEAEIKIIPFQVKSNVVVFSKENEQLIIKPFVEKNGNMVLVSKLSLHENPLKIKIYYQDTSLVFEETIENKQLLNRKYDFSTSEKGTYRIVLFSEGREFTKEFKI
jgi:hypothetical protein